MYVAKAGKVQLIEDGTLPYWQGLGWAEISEVDTVATPTQTSPTGVLTPGTPGGSSAGFPTPDLTKGPFGLGLFGVQRKDTLTVVPANGTLFMPWDHGYTYDPGGDHTEACSDDFMEWDPAADVSGLGAGVALTVKKKGPYIVTFDMAYPTLSADLTYTISSAPGKNTLNPWGEPVGVIHRIQAGNLLHQHIGWVFEDNTPIYVGLVNTTGSPVSITNVCLLFIPLFPVA